MYSSTSGNYTSATQGIFTAPARLEAEAEADAQYEAALTRPYNFAGNASHSPDTAELHSLRDDSNAQTLTPGMQRNYLGNSASASSSHSPDAPPLAATAREPMLAGGLTPAGRTPLKAGGGNSSGGYTATPPRGAPPSSHQQQQQYASSARLPRGVPDRGADKGGGGGGGGENTPLSPLSTPPYSAASSARHLGAAGGAHSYGTGSVGGNSDKKGNNNNKDPHGAVVLKHTFNGVTRVLYEDGHTEEFNLRRQQDRLAGNTAALRSSREKKRKQSTAPSAANPGRSAFGVGGLFSTPRGNNSSAGGFLLSPPTGPTAVSAAAASSGSTAFSSSAAGTAAAASGVTAPPAFGGGGIATGGGGILTPLQPALGDDGAGETASPAAARGAVPMLNTESLSKRQQQIQQQQQQLQQQNAGGGGGGDPQTTWKATVAASTTAGQGRPQRRGQRPESSEGGGGAVTLAGAADAATGAAAAPPGGKSGRHVVVTAGPPAEGEPEAAGQARPSSQQQQHPIISTPSSAHTAGSTPPKSIIRPISREKAAAAGSTSPTATISTEAVVVAGAALGAAGLGQKTQPQQQLQQPPDTFLTQLNSTEQGGRAAGEGTPGMLLFDDIDVVALDDGDDGDRSSGSSSSDDEEDEDTGLGKKRRSGRRASAATESRDIAVLREQQTQAARRVIKPKAQSMFSVPIPEMDAEGVILDDYFYARVDSAFGGGSTGGGGGWGGGGAAAGGSEGGGSSNTDTLSAAATAAAAGGGGPRLPCGWTARELYRILLEREQGSMRSEWAGLDISRLMETSDVAGEVALNYFWFIVLHARRAWLESLLIGRYQRLVSAFQELFPRVRKRVLPTLMNLELLVQELQMAAPEWRRIHDGIVESDPDGDDAAIDAASEKDFRASRSASASSQKQLRRMKSWSSQQSLREERTKKQVTLEDYLIEGGYITILRVAEIIKTGTLPDDAAINGLTLALDRFVVVQQEYRELCEKVELGFHRSARLFGEAAQARLEGSLKDTVIDTFNTIVVREVYFSLLFCFPNDAHAGLFNAQFRADMVRILQYWFTGLVITNVGVRGWLAPRPADYVASSEARRARAEERSLTMKRAISSRHLTGDRLRQAQKLGTGSSFHIAALRGGAGAAGGGGGRQSDASPRPLDLSGLDDIVPVTTLTDGDSSMNSSTASSVTSEFTAAVAAARKRRGNKPKTEGSSEDGGSKTKRRQRGHSQGSASNNSMFSPHFDMSDVDMPSADSSRHRGGGGGGAPGLLSRGDGGAAGPVTPASRSAANTPRFVVADGSGASPRVPGSSATPTPRGNLSRAGNGSGRRAGRGNGAGAVTTPSASATDKAGSRTKPLDDNTFDGVDIEVINGEYRLISEYRRYAAHAGLLVQEANKQLKRQHQKQKRRNQISRRMAQHTQKEPPKPVKAMPHFAPPRGFAPPPSGHPSRSSVTGGRHSTRRPPGDYDGGNADPLGWSKTSTQRPDSPGGGGGGGGGGRGAEGSVYASTTSGGVGGAAVLPFDWGDDVSVSDDGSRSSEGSHFNRSHRSMGRSFNSSVRHCASTARSLIRSHNASSTSGASGTIGGAGSSVAGGVGVGVGGSSSGGGGGGGFVTANGETEEDRLAREKRHLKVELQRLRHKPNEQGLQFGESLVDMAEEVRRQKMQVALLGKEEGARAAEDGGKKSGVSTTTTNTVSNGTAKAGAGEDGGRDGGVPVSLLSSYPLTHAEAEIIMYITDCAELRYPDIPMPPMNEECFSSGKLLEWQKQVHAAAASRRRRGSHFSQRSLVSGGGGGGLSSGAVGASRKSMASIGFGGSVSRAESSWGADASMTGTFSATHSKLPSLEQFNSARKKYQMEQKIAAAAHTNKRSSREGNHTRLPAISPFMQDYAYRALHVDLNGVETSASVSTTRGPGQSRSVSRASVRNPSTSVASPQQQQSGARRGGKAAGAAAGGTGGKEHGEGVSWNGTANSYGNSNNNAATAATNGQSSAAFLLPSTFPVDSVGWQKSARGRRSTVRVESVGSLDIHSNPPSPGAAAALAVANGGGGGGGGNSRFASPRSGQKATGTARGGASQVNSSNLNATYPAGSARPGSSARNASTVNNNNNGTVRGAVGRMQRRQARISVVPPENSARRPLLLGEVRREAARRAEVVMDDMQRLVERDAASRGVYGAQHFRSLADIHQLESDMMLSKLRAEARKALELRWANKGGDGSGATQNGGANNNESGNAGASGRLDISGLVGSRGDMQPLPLSPSVAAAVAAGGGGGGGGGSYANSWELTPAVRSSTRPPLSPRDQQNFAGSSV